MIFTWIVLLFLGLFVGILSGLLGIGGGIILVPMLATILPLVAVDQSVAVHLALGTSMACTSLTLLSTSIAHRSNGNLNQEVFYKILPGIIIGAIISPYLAHLLPAVALRHIIGFVLFALAINMAFDYEIPSTRKLPNRYFVILAGILIGLISSFSGLSGSVFVVPYLIWFGTSIRYAVGTAAMCGLVLSLAGMTSYMIVGYHTANLPDYAIGYVYLPAVILIAVTGMPMAQLSAKWSLKIPKEILKRLLAILLTFVAAKMLFFN
jgi:uncharacterized membrane protein YfcA